MQVSNDKEMIMTVSSRIIVSTVIVLVVLTVQSAAAQQAPVPPRGNQPTNANEPRATNGTVYTNKTELFATFRPPFIVGQATRIGAHLPKLGDRVRMLENNPASSRVLAVPRTAILQIEGAPHVYVQRHPEAFDLKEVKTGKSSGTYVEITSGLREGERIVIKGADRMPRK